MFRILSYISVVSLLLLSSCTEVIENYQSPAAQSVLTFEGGISNLKGPHSISIYRTSAELNDFTSKTPISKAIIYVLDEKNNKIEFKEINAGFYQTAANVQGKIGSTYRLFMEMDGKKFESLPETMPEITEIESVYSEPSIKEALPKTSNLRGGFDIYLDFKDSQKTGEYYRWTWKNYSKVRYCSQCKAQWDFAKNACDEANVSRFAMRLNHVCQTGCWDVKYSDNFNILSDGLSNGKLVKKLFIARVPNLFNEYQLPFDKYFYEIEQRSLTRSAYFHFKTLQEQADKSGTLFDVPTLTAFNLNIKPVGGNNEKILGVFEVYSASKKSIAVKIGEPIKNEEPMYNRLLQALDCFPNPCVAPCIESLYRTQTKPEGWIE